MTPTSQIIKNTWRLILPISTARLITMITSFVGILIIARISQDVLAASALISSTQAFLFFSGYSLLFSVSAMVGQAFGGKRYEEIGSIFQQALLYGMLVSLPIMLIQGFIGPILLLLKQTPSIASIVQDYFIYYLWGNPAMAGAIVCQQFLLAVNQRRFVFLMSSFNLIVAVGSAWVLVNGLWGFPKVGVGGLGLAYAIQLWLTFGIYFYYCYSQQEFAHYSLFTCRVHRTFHLLKKLFSIGWPITVQSSADLLSFFLLSIFAGWLGTDALAAQQIVTQYFVLLCVPVFAIAQASTILIGQSYGAKAYEDINRYAYAALGFAMGFSILILLLFVLFPHTLIQLYTQRHPASQAIEHLAAIVLILTGFRLLFDSMFEVNVGSLRGLYDTRYPMIMTTLFVLVINVPLAYCLAFVFHFGLIGMTAGGVVLTVICACILWRRWRNMVQKKISDILQSEAFSIRK